MPSFATELDTEIDSETQPETAESEASEDTAESTEELESTVSPDVVAEDERYVSAKNTGTSYSCIYDSKEQKIRISGSVTHDIYIKHRDYSIMLYKIAPGETLDSVLGAEKREPLVSTEISIKFNFTTDVKSVYDLFSQYVVVLASSEGQIDFIGATLYPSVNSTYEFDAYKDDYKGVVISGSDSVFQSEPSTAVIPLYLDKLVSDNAMGYFHTVDDKTVFFNREYVDEIDKTVRNLSSCGSKIYFQLLLNVPQGEDPTVTKYGIPDFDSLETINEIYTYCDFLSKRYSTYKNGFISGMIIGKSLDDVETYNVDAYESKEDYAKALALYGIIVGNAVRNNIPSADIAYSFTNLNTYKGTASDIKYAPSELMDSISRFFEDYYSEDFDFTVVLESTHRPLDITNEMLVEGINISSVNEGTHVVERNTDVFVKYLDSLEKKYSSAPCGFMYVWTIDADLSGNALACAYSYLYYKFFAIDNLSALVVSFEDHPDAVYDILNLVKYIDTDQGIDVTSQLLQFFKEYSWSQVVYNFDAYDYGTRKNEIINEPGNKKNVTGEFYYFDFNIESKLSSWFAGRGFSDVSIVYSSLFGRALSAKFDVDNVDRIAYDYLLCSYEYPENFVYTPKLTLLMSIEGNTENIDIFEVKISFHNGANAYEYVNVVQTGRESELVVDLSEFSKEFMAEAMRISVRPISEASGEYNLNISSVKGESYELSNEELEQKIFEERLLIRNSAESLEEKDNSEMNIVIVVMSVVVALLIGAMLFIFLRREEQ